MKAVLVALCLLPFLLPAQSGSEDYVSITQKGLQESSLSILQKDPDLSVLATSPDPLTYVENVLGQQWNDLVVRFTAMSIDANKFNSTTEFIIRQLDGGTGEPYPPCFADWYFSELGLTVEMLRVLVDFDARAMASIVAKSAINKAKYNNCL